MLEVLSMSWEVAAGESASLDYSGVRRQALPQHSGGQDSTPRVALCPLHLHRDVCTPTVANT